MNKNKIYHIVVAAFFGLLLACSKDGSITDIVDTKPPIAVIITSGDTTMVTLDAWVIKFSKTQPCYPATEVCTFTVASSDAAVTNATYNWAFGDGVLATGTTVQHTYDASATFTAILTIKDANNKLIKAINFPIKAWGKPIRPIAIFSYKNDFPEDLNYVTFNSASSLNKGAIVNFFWNWGDGTTQNSAVGLVRHQFPTATTDKIYTVKLTITTDAGCTADTYLLDTIPAKYPITGNFSAIAYDACTNEQFVFTAEATSVPTGSVYNWHFSDGTGDLSGYSVNYRFKYMNDYDVILYITLDGREIYRTHKTVNAKGENPKPIASFYATLVGTTANTVKWSFNSQSTVAHGGIDGYRWDFGDGNSNNDYYSFIENTYTRSTNNATYKVRLITSANGCADTAYQLVNVAAK